MTEEKASRRGKTGQTKDLTEGNPLYLILSFAFPLLLGNLLQQTYNLCDAAIVGRFLGAGALAGVGASSSVQFLVLGFCTGSCTGFAVLTAQSFGAKDYNAMRQYIYVSWVLVAFLAVSITSVCALSCNKILALLQTPSDIYKDAYEYLLIIFLGIPFILLYNFSAAILRSIGDSRTPFVFLAFCTVLNIILDVLFIVIFKSGCKGAALATIISQGISGILCLVYMLKNYELLKLKSQDRVFDYSKMKKLLIVGIPLGLQFSITAIGSMIMQSANNALGSVYVSAFTAATKIKQFAISPFDALSTSVSTFVSQNYGAGKFSRIKKGFRQGIISGVILGLVLGLILIFGGRSLSMLFISSDYPDILDASGRFLKVGGFFYLIIPFLNVSRLTVQGLGFSRKAIFSGVIEMAARIIVSFTLVPVLGYFAICFCDQTAWVSATFYIFPYCLHCLKKIQKELEERKSAS